MQGLQNPGIRQLFRWLNREVYRNLEGDSEYADRVEETVPDAETVARNIVMLARFGMETDTALPAIQTPPLQLVAPANTAIATIPTPPHASTSMSGPSVASTSSVAPDPSVAAQPHGDEDGTSTAAQLEQALVVLAKGAVSMIAAYNVSIIFNLWTLFLSGG